METISNAWKHPKTSAAGLLIAISTIAGVLSQRGVTLGSAGSGTVVTLAGAIATALLGLLAKDPQTGNREKGIGNSTQKLSALMLCSLALLGTMPLAGCNGTSVAQAIVNWTPALQTAVTTVDSTVALLAPADAPVFAAATAGFDAASNVLVAQAKAYLASPSASVLAQLQTQVVTFQQQANAALLAAAKIVDPASQTHALAAINGVATIANAILALVQSVSSKNAVAQMAARSTIKLETVRELIDEDAAARLVAAQYGERVEVARVQIEAAEIDAMKAGF